MLFKKAESVVTIAELRTLELDIERFKGDIEYTEHRICELTAFLPKYKENLAKAEAELTEKMRLFKQQP